MHPRTFGVLLFIWKQQPNPLTASRTKTRMPIPTPSSQTHETPRRKTNLWQRHHSRQSHPRSSRGIAYRLTLVLLPCRGGRGFPLGCGGLRSESLLQGAATIRATRVPGPPVLRQTPSVENVLDGEEKKKKTSGENDIKNKTDERRFKGFSRR